MSPIEKSILAKLGDCDVVALTLFGEARGERIEGRIAIANVIANRVAAGRKGFGLTHRAVCLQPAQFSCWSPAGGAANYELLLETAVQLARGERGGPLLRECQWIADGLLREQFADTVKGATHYLTRKLLEEDPPTWAVNQPVLVTIGQHAFLRVA